MALASPLVAGDFLSPSHFFPIVSRTDGLAGTEWTTAVQIANPQSADLTITTRLSMAGGFETRTVVVAAGATRSWPDFLGEVFGGEGNGALFLEASPDANGNRPAECRSFAASMRISTARDDGGSFGQSIPSLDPVAGFLGDWVAVFPGAVLWGQPGVGGFRTNVGFWNVGAEDARLRLRLLDAAGHQVWQRVVIAARHEPFVTGLPAGLDLETATLFVDSFGEWVDCAVYISVVDNLTGDASFLTSQLMDPDTGFVCGTSAAGVAAAPPLPHPSDEQAAERLRSVFLGGAR